MKRLSFVIGARKCAYAFVALCMFAGILAIDGCVKHKIYLEFDSNGGVGEMRKQRFWEGVEQSLDRNYFYHDGCYAFSGWNTIPDGTGTSYTDGQKITISGSTTLYAQWTEIRYVVTFDANGGEGEMSPQVYDCQMQPLNANTFTREGYIFNGWYSEDGNSYEDGAKIKLQKDITLFARWLEED